MQQDTQRSAWVKPYPEFPLTPRADGRLCKKIAGVIRYFGRVEEWEKALVRYTRLSPYYVRGETPPPEDGDAGVTTDEGANRFLGRELKRLGAGEIGDES